MVARDSEVDLPGFLADVTDVARRHDGLIAYAGAEATVRVLLDNAEALAPDVVLPYGSTQSARVLGDKSVLPDLARQAGLRVAGNLAEGSAAELRSVAVSPQTVAVKPARGGQELASARLVDADGELDSLLHALPDEEELVLQERFTGRMGSLALVVDGSGRLLARFQHAVRRLWPREAGSTAEAVSVAPDDGVVRAAMKLLATAGYCGLAQLDFFESDRGPIFIDVNPRFYASIPLALASGVNLPAAWHAAVTGTPVAPPARYHLGVSFRWLEADLLAAARGLPQLLRRPPAPSVGAAWDARDPVPGALAAVDAVVGRVKRRLG